MHIVAATRAQKEDRHLGRSAPYALSHNGMDPHESVAASVLYRGALVARNRYPATDSRDDAVRARRD
jgi:hypothetical protein